MILCLFSLDPCVFLKLFQFIRSRAVNQATHTDWIQLDLQVTHTPTHTTDTFWLRDSPGDADEEQHDFRRVEPNKTVSFSHPKYYIVCDKWNALWVVSSSSPLVLQAVTAGPCASVSYFSWHPSTACLCRLPCIAPMADVADS